MSLQDLVVMRVRGGIDRVVAESPPANAPDGAYHVRIESTGTERDGERHYMVRRGHELVRVTIEQVER